ncbi:MAG: hypothetical protein JXO22_12195 [Phycisphaerae bacterium]|nr:hypothetical protein [Phycisphaerae bacterium]
MTHAEDDAVEPGAAVVEDLSVPDASAQNGSLAGGRPSLAAWEFAGLFTTYWCNARCAICYVCSGPGCGGEMRVAMAVRLWQELDELAASQGNRMRIHLAGGEPFGDWPRLAAIVRAAHDAGLAPTEKVETNAFWAVNDGLVRSRLELLDAFGMERLVVSTDVYHQEFVPFERVRRCVEIAREVLGPERVRVRWWDFYNEPVDVARLSPNLRRAAQAAALDRHKDRLTGRAASRLSDLLLCRPAEELAGLSCEREVLGSKHVHIDGYGNIFPGVCAGIILGNAATRDVAQVWHDLAALWQEHPVVSAVVAGGSHALMRAATPHGYQPRTEGYAGKCHLCHDVRRFLAARGIWPEHIGPRECYGD